MTERFIRTTKPDIMDIKIFNPIPGTKVFDDLVEDGTIKKPKNLLEWADWTGNWRDMKHNFSKIPDAVLWKMAEKFWGYNYYRSRIKKAIFWIRKGRIKYVTTKIRQGLIKGYNKEGLEL